MSLDTAEMKELLDRAEKAIAANNNGARSQVVVSGNQLGTTEQLRVQALRAAVDSYDTDCDTDDIISTAREFMTFLEEG